jgi:hypothetical protein
MKLIALLSRVATASIAIAVTGLVFNAVALALFAAAAMALVLLITSTDYGHRPVWYAMPVTARPTESRPLAA